MVDIPAPATAPLAGAPLPGAPSPTAPASELRRAAEEFESVFLAQMLAPMFAGLDTDGLGGGGMGEEMFRPMLIEQYAAAISRAGGIGLADSVVREFMRLQTTAPDTSLASSGDTQ
jgi:Rod binding domain-containing protein